MQPDARVMFADCRPFGRCLLDTVFGEIALSGGNQGLDGLGGAPLGDGNQRDLPRFTPRDLARGRNRIANFGQFGSRISGQNLKAVPT